MKNNTPEVEEYVWVEGYKGVHEDFTGCGGFQYAIGETYTCEGTPQMCANGFHFCLTLKDVFTHYNWMKSRFVKVKGYVRKKDLDNYGKSLTPFSSVNKLVSKSITILEEVSVEEIYHAAISPADKYIITLEDFDRFYRNSLNWDEFILDVCKSSLTSLYSDVFIGFLINRHKTSYWWQKLELTHFAMGLALEDIPHETRVKMLLERLETEDD